ncbi:uncharacterized protein BO97DRAFT_159781 [Aspergillus homomorphus CBS 101889]|uniref:Uncharacterized protein n=1 Tax=Aspergillus homomorphus (strain CBS 101889) TaxID=1450537 RepID=A0A395HR32_ASPHC|nr:hypothetical protein BO97DRAFT_159781 [Aspergillus homomorphus CBS 101889]RAL09755.1 hypothetical protein BO97DRAFT_159781 [Aspergillus homomorphus CBS 101889]
MEFLRLCEVDILYRCSRDYIASQAGAQGCKRCRPKTRRRDQTDSTTLKGFVSRPTTPLLIHPSASFFLRSCLRPLLHSKKTTSCLDGITFGPQILLSKISSSRVELCGKMQQSLQINAGSQAVQIVEPMRMASGRNLLPETNTISSVQALYRPMVDHGSYRVCYHDLRLSKDERQNMALAVKCTCTGLFSLYHLKRADSIAFPKSSTSLLQRPKFCLYDLTLDPAHNGNTPGKA